MGAIQVTVGLPPPPPPPPQIGKTAPPLCETFHSELCVCVVEGRSSHLLKRSRVVNTQGVVSSPGLLSTAFLWDFQSKPTWRSLCWKKATECQAFSELEKGVFQTAAVYQRLSELLFSSCLPYRPRPAGVSVLLKISSGL